MNIDKSKLLELVNSVSAYNNHESLKFLCTKKCYKTNKELIDEICKNNGVKLALYGEDDFVNNDELFYVMKDLDLR